MDHDELKRRREEREVRRQQRLAEQRKLQIRLIIAAVVLLVCGVAIFLLTRGGKPDDTLQTEQTTTAPTAEAAASESAEATVPGLEEDTTVIHIRAAGDLNVTDNVILSGASSNGYDFTEAFMDVAPVLANADLTILNFEGNLCGEPYGTKTTSAPVQLAQALRACGVDMVQMANSCAVNNGVSGMVTTLDNLRSAGIEPIGAYKSNEEFEKSKGYTIVEINGITVAFVSFTKGVGSRGLPVGSEDCVNLLYVDYATTYQEVDEDGIRKILKAVEAEKPDITIAMLHWGSEYNDAISSTQKEIAELMTENGVDVIIGTHSHMVQQIEYDAQTGQLIAYSLGDFYGDATNAGTNYSIILDIEITRDNVEKTTRVTGYSVIPIYTLSETEGGGQRRVVRIQEAMTAYENNYVDRVTKEAYDAMAYALVRIDERIKGQ